MPTESRTAVARRADDGDETTLSQRVGKQRRMVILVVVLLALVSGVIVGLESLRTDPPFPEPEVTLLSEDFEGEDGVFADERRFWHSDSPQDEQEGQASGWFAESGVLERRGSEGWTDSPVMRVWTQRDDLAFTQVEMDVTFNGWSDGSDGWHGVNLWMNESLCTPFPECDKIDDGDEGGPSGYALDFMNRDGTITILKKVAGDTRDTWPGATTYSNGGTYYELAEASFEPVQGRTYHFAGRAIDTGNGTTTLQVMIDGDVLLQVVDDGSVAGPRLTGGRVGLRSDYADLTVDDILIRR